ncbi:MAG: 2-oxo acid dehydrogenase subunit E2, partial [Planctomycetaceae bacterium]
MARTFHIPAIDEGVESVDLASLNVSTGDVLKAGTVVAEVETDKAAADLEIDFGGIVTEIHAAPGDTVLVGSVLLTVDDSGDTESTPVTPAAASPATVPAEPAPVVIPETVEPPDPAPAADRSASTIDDSIPAPAGPATRRLARQLGVNLHRVTGTAAGGRITREDVQGHVKSIMTSGPAGGSGQTLPPLPDYSRWGQTERVPLNRIGRSTAANLSLCWNVIPHVTQHDLVDITELEAARRRLAALAATTGTPKVTMTAISMKAAAICLKEFPQFNAALDPLNNELVYRKYF